MPTADGEQHLQQTGQQAVAESWNQPIFPSQDNQGGQKKNPIKINAKEQLDD